MWNPFERLSKISDESLIEKHNQSLEMIHTPSTSGLQKTFDVANGALLTGGLLLAKKQVRSVSKMGMGLFENVAHHATTVPGAIATGALTALALVWLDRVINRQMADSELKDQNKEIEKRFGKNPGFNTITSEDLAAMKAAKGHAIGTHTQRAIAGQGQSQQQI